MRVSSLCLVLQTSFSLAAADYIDWKTYEANGVNLGGWLCQESTIDTTWWAQYSKGAPDEWGLCVNQGSLCGSVLEKRYATYITTADIDKLHTVGINTLRIPTTYAAWIKVPGSQLYSGNQVDFLKNIATYAITKYGMHVIIDVHSLPGGVNGMPFGEAEGHFGWFNNQTAFDYSLKTIDAVLSYVQDSDHPDSYTIAPVNEPVDNEDMSTFGTPAALSDDGAAWVLKYIQEVLSKVAAVNPKIPVMFQGSFRSPEYWSPKLSSSDNVVFDVHNYYFAGRGATGANITSYICADAENAAGDGTFPTFVGEWSIQAELENIFAGRQKALNTGLFAFAKYSRGSSYWTAKFSGNATVDGEGVQADYWNYMTWIDQDMIHPDEGEGVCA
ncbi:glycoside hydrolase superfamily [Aspergillus pseudocaelatus]|uniref:glucan 1,3-beta-glucosidase n=1 Tax=Aspergillus pseudocaelatus TaxID=1825620 RepID=A0ABQ6WZH1_9EURO|nr:glycoside hydrolase superfamily [Aspergillus pseudocaelatus]